MCKWKYRIEDSAIIHNEWWVEYVNKKFFKSDNWCDKFCDETQQKVCDLLLMFDVIEAKDKEIKEEKREMRVANTQRAEEERKIRQLGLPNNTTTIRIKIIEITDQNITLDETDDIIDNRELELYDFQESFVTKDKVTRRTKSKEKERIWELNNGATATVQ